MANYEKLKLNIKEFVKTKLRSIKSVEDIPASYFTINQKCESDILYWELGIYRKILQLTMNVFNNYATFRNLSVKFTVHDEKYLSPFDEYYNFDKDLNLWRCVSPPKNDQMEAAFFKYILCLKSLDVEDDVVEVKDEEICFDECPYCNFRIKDVGEDCVGCSSSYEDMLEYTRKVYEDKLRINHKMNKTSRFNICTLKKNEGFNVIEKESKWECGDCKYLNEYGVNDCIACRRVYEDGRWTCRGCKEKNMCFNDNCRKCGNKNVNLIVEGNDISESSERREETKSFKQNETVNDRKIITDQWKCRTCELFFSFNDFDCGKCGVSREMCGEWTCGMCTLINRCSNSKCDVCEQSNIRLEKKHYKSDTKVNKEFVSEMRNDDNIKINMNEVLRKNEVTWTWTLNHCNEQNSETEMYCWKCKLHRFNSRVHGDPVKALFNNHERSVWICVKCRKLNELTEPVCHCGGFRYKKIFCHNCQQYTDGRSDRCYQCTHYA